VSALLRTGIVSNCYILVVEYVFSAAPPPERDGCCHTLVGTPIQAWKLWWWWWWWWCVPKVTPTSKAAAAVAVQVVAVIAAASYLHPC
jgi:hypothetical protein